MIETRQQAWHLAKQSAEVLDGAHWRLMDPAELLRPMVDAADRLRKMRAPSAPARQLALNSAIARWRRSGGTLNGDFQMREIRALCSQYEFLTDERFISALRQRPDCLERRSFVEAMIRTYLASWESHANMTELERFLGQTVIAFAGSSQRISQYKSVARHMFSPHAAEWLAESAVAEWEPIDQVLGRWAIAPGTGLGNAASSLVPALVIKRLGRPKLVSGDRDLLAAVEYFASHLCPADHISPSRLGPLATALIQGVDTSDDAGPRDLLKACFLESPRYGDPRLSANDALWAYVGENGRTTVSGWLSEASLEFFFQEVLPERKDPHGRRAFWRSYLGAVADCLVVLCEEDERRLSGRLDSNVLYGTMEGSLDTSAFLMKFKGATEVIVVEFSRTGNAIHVHDNTRFTHATGGGIRKPGLRFHHLKDLKRANTRVEHLTHQGSAWQYKVRSSLSRFGIRPR